MDCSVGLISYSHSRYGRLEQNVPQLLKEAITSALNNVEKGIEPKDIGLLIVSSVDNQFSNQHQMGALGIQFLGNPAGMAFRVEAACASGGMATYVASRMIESGYVKNALVVGLEKMTNLPTDVVTSILIRGGAPEEVRYGVTQPAAYALQAQLYMNKYGATEEDYAMAAVKNHENALRNPWAQFQKKITVEDVKNSKLVASPIRLYHCSPITDGAAAVILSGDPKTYTDTPVYLKGMGIGHDAMGVHEREDPAFLKASKIAADVAYHKAGVTPEDVDIAEVHDAFSHAELMAYEAVGFAEKGEGFKLLREGRTMFNGDLPVNVSGGLKAKGHPIGATGVGMLVEMYLQLRGEAGNRQVPDVSTALVENHGGTGATSVVTILGR
jgi:acetyl-CoA C-acetyltransferase